MTTLHLVLLIDFVLFFLLILIWPFADRKLKFIALSIHILLPFFGQIIISIFYVLVKNSKAVDYGKYLNFFDDEIEDVKFDKSLGAEKTVPIEEALLINDDNVQREIILDVAKNNPKDFISDLKKALLVDDSETAHYAASIITSLIRKYDLEIKEKRENFDFKNDGDSKKAFIKVLKLALDSKLLLENNESIYREELYSLLKIEIEKNNQEEYYFEEMAIFLIEAKRYQEVLKHLKEYEEKFYLSDRPFYFMLQVFFATKDENIYNLAKQKIDKYKGYISNDIYNLLKFWGE